jgi:hypothetical protein
LGASIQSNLPSTIRRHYLVNGPTVTFRVRQLALEFLTSRFPKVPSIFCPLAAPRRRSTSNPTSSTGFVLREG